jgi:hypothetical protein
MTQPSQAAPVERTPERDSQLWELAQLVVDGLMTESQAEAIVIASASV